MDAMHVAGAARLVACRALWRATGLRAAGRALVRALGSRDEDLRTLAGMLLVKEGQHAEPLLHEAMHRRENLPMVLWVLGSIGDKELESEIREFSRDRDPSVARAAQDALRVLDHGLPAER
jgi:hypothetical protein